MIFDKERCFSALTADAVKVGSKGYFADSPAGLRLKVCSDITEEYGEITEIHDDDCLQRFCMNDGDSKAFFYLVEEPKEKKYRPYKDTCEMLCEFKKHNSFYGNRVGGNTPMHLPLVWVKTKDLKLSKLIFQYGIDTVYVASELGYMGILNIGMQQLLEEYTYLDGTPCGVEEECEQ